MHKTSAWPLALLYIALVVYASLYPFSDWRYQGVVPWGFLWAPIPPYWTGFDLISNAVGYMPIGFLLALSALRTGRGRHAVKYATLAGAGLSLLMESLQVYLPARVPSNVDFALNVFGTLMGASAAELMEKLGAIDRWSRFRARWFVPNARGALVLLILWPMALLFPAAVPFGLGQVYERLEAGLADMLLGTPFLEWLPVRDMELQPLVAGAEMICVMLGALVPCLLGFSIITAAGRRTVFVMVLLASGVAATTLSAALSYGPAHAWAWLNLPVVIGLVMAWLLGMALIGVSDRASAALMLLGLGLYLSVINQAPTSAYFTHTLKTWEQGRFIRFHGLVQWLGWLWPYASVVYVLARIGGRDARN